MFDPYNFDYTAYMLETYNLTEMPNKMVRIKVRAEDHILNSEDSIWVEKIAEYLGKWTIKNASMTWRLFLHKEGNIWTYYLLDEDTPFICGEYSFERVVGPLKGIENKHIWNFKWDRGLIRLFIDYYILEREPVIISDKLQTESGFNFWKYLFREHVKYNKSHKMYVMDINNGEVILSIADENQMDQYYTETNSGKFRFVLERI